MVSDLLYHWVSRLQGLGQVLFWHEMSNVQVYYWQSECWNLVISTREDSGRVIYEVLLATEALVPYCSGTKGAGQR